MSVFRSGRGGPTQGQLAIRGLLLLAVFALLLFVMSLSLGGAFADTSPVRTTLDTAGGSIGPGSDVKMNGLVVGRVSSVAGDEKGVNLGLELDNSQIDGIPASVQARVLPATVFGTSYIDLVARKGTDGSKIRAGDVIPQDTSVPTLELQKALDSIDKIVDALGPAQLSSALHALSSAVDGRGDQLGKTLDTLGGYLDKLQPEVPLVRADLRLLATNVDTLRRTSPQLLDAVDDALYVGNHLVQQRAQLTSLLTGGLNLVRDTDSFLTDNERKFVATVVQSAIVTDAIYDNRVGLREGLLVTGNITGRIQTAFEGERWIRVIGRVTQKSVREYTRADCPRYGSDPGANCPGAGRAAVGPAVGSGAASLVAGSLVDGGDR